MAAVGNDLYVGGDFSTANGTVTVNNIASWNGSAWTALGTGMDGFVHAIIVSGSNVFVGGDFAEAGVVRVNGVARWDGSNWFALGAGLSSATTNTTVTALTGWGTNLFVGGTFTSAGGTDAMNVARWDGTGWNALGSGVNGPVSTLDLAGTDLFVGGNFTAAGGKPSWHFAQWHDVPKPANDDFEGRILLAGAWVVTHGDNTGASKQLDEPYHAGIYGGRSI